MFGKVHYPVTILPEELDEYLKKGWFRMGQTIFTSCFLFFKGTMYDAIWLRIDLEQLEPDSTFLKLKKQNSKFHIEIRPAQITEEKNRLFSQYREHVSFEPSASLQDLLFGQENSDVYNTWEVCIYDYNRLIACGFFDIGLETAAGITSFYDPDYKKYSLGKYLIYLKTEYVQKTGRKYFYPGYFAPGYPLFDYKLTIGKSKLEYYDCVTKSWKHIQEFYPEESPLSIIRDKLLLVKNTLSRYQIDSDIFYYEFFNANLVPEFYTLELFDYPMLLSFMKVSPELVPPVVVYDPRQQQYRLVQCKSLYTLDHGITPEGNYCQHLFKEDQILFETTQLEELCERVHFLQFVFSNLNSNTQEDTEV